MSLDFDIVILDEIVVSKNITHNLGQMWKEAGIYDALYMSEGKKAEEILPVLKEGLNKMIDDPIKYKAFDAPNGWGEYRDALPWLTELIAEIREYPDGIISISK